MFFGVFYLGGDGFELLRVLFVLSHDGPLGDSVVQVAFSFFGVRVPVYHAAEVFFIEGFECLEGGCCLCVVNAELVFGEGGDEGVDVFENGEAVVVDEGGDGIFCVRGEFFVLLVVGVFFEWGGEWVEEVADGLACFLPFGGCVEDVVFDGEVVLAVGELFFLGS